MDLLLARPTGIAICHRRAYVLPTIFLNVATLIRQRVDGLAISGLYNSIFKLRRLVQETLLWQPICGACWQQFI